MHIIICVNSNTPSVSASVCALPPQVTHALLVAAYESGSPCDVHFLSEEQCREQWERWLERLDQFKTCFAHDLSNVY